MLRAILNISERRVHQQQATTSGFGRLAAPVRAVSAAAPRAWLYTLCQRTFPAAEAALGLQPASSAVSLVGSFICQMQGGDRGHCTIGSRAAAADAIHRATLSAQWFRPGDLPPEQTSCAAVGASRACTYSCMLRPINISWRRVHPTRSHLMQQMCTERTLAEHPCCTHALQSRTRTVVTYKS